MVIKAVAGQGYETPTPIRQQANPPLREGRDLLGIAQTGTGKTAAFTLPTLDKMARKKQQKQPKSVRVLVLVPTRELAYQVADSFKAYSKFLKCWVEVAIGGVKIGGQIRALKRGAEVLVATPGRLVDLIGQNAVNFDQLDTLILDEADHMLDLGFARDLRKVMEHVPDARQTMLFSATMPKEIEALAKEYLFDPVKVSVAPESTTAERVTQGVHHVAKSSKPRMLASILSDPGIDRALVFARTKHGADAIVRQLDKAGIEAKAIHGNKSQPQRTKALEAFRDGTCNVLIATDIAARGIDVRGVSHVVNYELPNVPEQYVHRIGRTARAGADGVAVSLVTADELYYLCEIEKITRAEIPVLDAPEGLEDLILPTPDRSMKLVKPKGPQTQQRSNKPRGGGQGQAKTGRPAAKRGAAPAKKKSPAAGRGAPGGKPRRPRNNKPKAARA